MDGIWDRDNFTDPGFSPETLHREQNLPSFCELKKEKTRNDLHIRHEILLVQRTLAMNGMMLDMLVSLNVLHQQHHHQQ